MTRLPILREAIQPRLDGIRDNLSELETLGRLPLEEFNQRVNFDRAHHNVRIALEGVFYIVAHILSRIPGGRETEYKRMARKLGELGLIDREFAETKLVAMGGYRNRLTHFYAEVKADELHDICRTKLADIEIYLKAIAQIMQHPERFGLTVE